MPNELEVAIKVNTNLDQVEAQLDRIIEKAGKVKELTGQEVATPTVILD